MAGQRTAGYCSHCNRGVSIVRPEASGLMNKMRTALKQSDDDSNWVCTKCGQPATRGFAPARKEVVAVADANPTDEIMADAIPAPQTMASSTHTQSVALPAQPADNNCPSCDTPLPANSLRCPTCNQSAASPGKLEVSCHLCHKPIPFSAAAANSQIDCPTCQQPIILPGFDGDTAAITKSPVVIKLEDNPNRPEISKALCTLCHFELTYPKRLTGKSVDCPSCAVHFSLP